MLFLTLPFGVRSSMKMASASPAPIPARRSDRMGRKLIWTTIISAVIFAVAWFAYHAGYLSIERLSKLMGMPF